MREKGTWMGRVILESLDMSMVRFVVVLVVFLTALAAIDSDWKLPSSHLGDRGPWKVEDTGENAEAQVWIDCMKELQEISENGPYLDSHFSPPSRGNHSFIKSYYNAFLAKRSLWEVISNLLFQEEHFCSDCTRVENPPSLDLLNGDLSDNPFINFKASVSSWFKVPRRYLRYKMYKNVAIESSPVHSPAPSPRHSVVSPISSPQSPANSHSPVLSPSPRLKPPTPSPKQTPIDAPAPPQNVPNFPPKQPNNPQEVPNATPEPSRRKAKSSPSENHEDSSLVIVAIAACTVTALAFVAVFLICSLGEEDDGDVGQRDEKPLLRLGSCDISPGVSQNTQSIENPDNKGSPTLSTVNNLAVATETNSPSGNTTMATGAAPANSQMPLLPLPPGKSAPPPPAPSAPAPPPPKPPAPKAPAPPPPKGRAPPPPRPGALSSGPRHRGLSSGSDVTDGGDSPKTKLKPFFWDKVNASPDNSMVWHELKAGSFQFNEEMMESLFGYAQPDQNKNDRKKDLSAKAAPQFISIIDPKKAQNLAILLKALNVTTEEVCDALTEGNELPTELVQTLLKMAPMSDEELKLRLYAGDISMLGPADRFLKIIIEIPFAFKRMESLLFMSGLQEEVSYIRESFATLEVASNELKSSRLFLKLLEAVLKTGNRMNTGTYRGGAQAFKLDTLLKLSDVKGTDGKTTLLHFVVQEIIRSEGIRAARRLRESHSVSSVKTEDLIEDIAQDSSAEYHRNLGLQVVSRLSSELKNVRKASVIDGDNLTQSVAKLSQALLKAKNFLETDMMSIDEESEFWETLANFLEFAEGEVPTLLKEEQRIMALVKSTGDYFHGNTGKDEGLRLFVIVRDFLIMLDKVCKEVEREAKLSPAPKVAPPKKETSVSLPSIRESQTESSSSLPSSQEPQTESLNFLPSSQEPQTESSNSLPSSQEPKTELSNSLPSSQEPQTESSNSLPSSQEPQTELLNSLPSSQEPQTESSNSLPSSQESKTESSLPDVRQQLFPAITARKINDDFSSDSDSDSD